MVITPNTFATAPVASPEQLVGRAATEVISGIVEVLVLAQMNDAVPVFVIGTLGGALRKACHGP